MRELNTKQSGLIQFINLNLKDICKEIEDTKSGSSIYNDYGGSDIYYDGFILNVDSDITIKLDSFDKNYVRFYEINLIYKDIEVLRVELPKNNPTSYTLFDSYNRESEDSRHDLDKAFNFFLDHIQEKFQIPYLKRIEEQNLYRDKMYDEYLEKISDTSRILG
jgi:hypothetical protein